MNNGKIIKVLFVRSALVNDLCMSIAKQHSNVVAKNEMFISAVGSQSWIDAEVDHVVGKKKGTGGSSSEAVLIFTQREDTQVSTSNSVFGLDPIISVFNGARLLPASSI